MAPVRVTRQFLDNYRKQVDAQADIAADYFGRAVDAFHASSPDASVAEFRDFVIDLYGVALPNFTELEETLSCSVFDALAESVGFDGEKARTYDTIDYEQVEEKVHYMARHLANDDVEAFKREVVDITRYYAKRSAFQNMKRNCNAQEVKWARMPSGFETCPFCFMLASRGFVYANKKAASEGQHGYHNHCDCIAIPGFQGKDGNPRVRIDGYDPGTMARSLTNCEQALGGRNALEDEWDNLPDEEKAKWLDRHKGPNGEPDVAEARKAYVDNRVFREIATRDWHWLYTGEAPLRVRRYTAEEVLPNMKGQFGQKARHHARDWGLDPSSERDRDRLFEIARNIVKNATEVFPRDEWRGQPDGVVFYLLGNDVVMTKPNGEYITIMKDAAINNGKVIDARAQNTKRQ